MQEVAGGEDVGEIATDVGNATDIVSGEQLPALTTTCAASAEVTATATVTAAGATAIGAIAGNSIRSPLPEQRRAASRSLAVAVPPPLPR